MILLVGLSIILFIIIGTITLVFNIYISHFSNYIETQGCVIDCTADYDYDAVDPKYSRVTHTSIIEYKAGRKSYTLKYNKKLQIGKKISIMYNPDNPNKAEIKNNLVGLEFIGFGIVILIIFILVNIV